MLDSPTPISGPLEDYDGLMALETQIDKAISAPADQLLLRFFDPNGPFAGATFDDVGVNPPDRIVTDDLVAVSLLDVRFEPRAVRAMLKSEPDIAQLKRMLTAIPAHVDLWNAEDHHLEAASALFDKLDGYASVGETKASKLLARKRPRLMPVIDSVIRRGLELRDNPAKALRTALSVPARRESIELLRPANVPRSISTIRLLDTAVWMRHSQSRNARRARQAAGL